MEPLAPGAGPGPGVGCQERQAIKAYEWPQGPDKHPHKMGVSPSFLQLTMPMMFEGSWPTENGKTAQVAALDLYLCCDPVTLHMCFPHRQPSTEGVKHFHSVLFTQFFPKHVKAFQQENTHNWEAMGPLIIFIKYICCFYEHIKEFAGIILGPWLIC